jgi:hypothetical protein
VARAHRPSAFAGRLALFAGALLPLTSAEATWSIILIDIRTGEIAVGSATCLSNFDLRAGTPVLIPGIGAATAQSFVDSTGQNRVYIRDRLAEGVSPQNIIQQLATFDSGHQTRQYGIVDSVMPSGRFATFSGTSAGAWAGGQTGSFNYTHLGREGTIAYAIQGNILTGAPVVEQAVQAVINTPGDLTARMMAGMQAARAMGGDGRCSCPAGPTLCGSPPPSFSKSAHIAYMLTARAGDREGSNGIYRAGSGAAGILAADVTGNSQPDLIITNASANSFSVQRNATHRYGEPGVPFPMFGPLPLTISTFSGPRGIAVADFNGDERPDLVISNTSAGNIGVYRAVGGPAFGFASPQVYVVGANPRAVVAADFDGHSGPDIATINSSSNAVAVLLNDGGGNFAAPTSISVPGGPWDLIAAHLVGPAAGAIDLAVICRSANQLVILEGNGSGGFSQAAGVATAAGPMGLAAGDFNGDGITDLAVACDTSSTVQVFLNNGNGGLTGASFSPGFAPTGIAAGDVTGDGRADVVITGAGNRFAVLRNTGGGALVLDRSYTVSGTVVGISLADLDGDGDLDIALASSNLASAITVRNDGPGPRQGQFNDGAGCATGDYFLNLNIAFQSTAAPDPVAQLQAQYDAWRTALAGRPDAVQSLVTIDPPVIATGAAATMTISLRDWQGQPITAPIGSVEIGRAPGAPALSTIGTVAAQGGGIYTVQLTAGAAPGIDRLRITVDDGQRPVVLMPETILTLVPACYPNCDHSTTPPILNVDDFTCFINEFASASALPQAQQITHYANCDGSTAAPVLNVDDFTCFINRYATGCP